MPDPDVERDPLEALAADFLERQRRGESPSAEEYAARHPELADEIRNLFPAVVALERVKARRQRSGSGLASLGPVRIERLGDFRIIREIGRGGMGIVYEAEQESLGRRVAVKVLPRQALLEPRHLARFRQEARLAAGLHHTSIVEVFGIGEQDGFHYYVMPLIRGVGLDRVIRWLASVGAGEAEAAPPASPGPPAVPGPPASPRPAAASAPPASPAPASAADTDPIGRAVQRLLDAGTEGGAAGGGPAAAASGPTGAASGPAAAASGLAVEPTGDGPVQGAAGAAPSVPRPPDGRRYWRSVAAIALQAAEALHYAHARGTLHRDVKPANLLVDVRGAVWVADFGLAKALQAEAVSLTGEVAGTLRYMAPEQFRGEVDARSDVYSLGLTLYELLALRPAFEDTDPSRLMHRLAHEPPAPLRRWTPRVPRDLETIVLKAMARDRSERYASARDLAADLRCFLEDRPIQARRATGGERLLRWCRRSPAVAGLSGTALALVVLVAVVATAGYVRTRAALEGEARQRAKAEANADLALEALDRVFARFAPARPVSAPELALDGSDSVVVEAAGPPVLSREAAGLLEEMLPFYDRLAAEAPDEASVRRKIAAANGRVGDIRQRLGQYDRAEAAYLRAVDLYRPLGAIAPQDAALSVETAAVRNALGLLYRSMQREVEAREVHGQALARLTAVASASPAPAGVRYELARTHYLLGARPPPQPGTGPPPPAGPPPAGRPGLGPGPVGPPPDGRPGLGDRPRPEPGAGPLPGGPPPGMVRPRPGPGGGALPPGAGPGRPRPVPPGAPLVARREEENHLARAIDLLGELVAEDASNPEYRHLLAVCFRDRFPRLGVRDPRAARQELEQATQILEQLAREFPAVPDYRHDLAETYAAVDVNRPPGPGQALDGIEQRLRQALRLAGQLVAEHPQVPQYLASQAHACHKLGVVLRRENRLDEALESDRKAVAAYESLVDQFPDVPSHKVWLGAFVNSLVDVLLRRGRTQEAGPLLDRSIASLEGLLKEKPQMRFLHGLLDRSLMAHAAVLRAAGKTDLAAEAERRAEAHRQTMPPTGTPPSPPMAAPPAPRPGAMDE